MADPKTKPKDKPAEAPETFPLPAGNGVGAAPTQPPEPAKPKAAGAARKPDPVIRTMARVDRVLADMPPKDAMAVVTFLYSRYGALPAGSEFSRPE